MVCEYEKNQTFLLIIVIISKEGSFPISYLSQVNEIIDF